MSYALEHIKETRNILSKVTLDINLGSVNDNNNNLNNNNTFFVASNRLKLLFEKLATHQENIESEIKQQSLKKAV